MRRVAPRQHQPLNQTTTNRRILPPASKPLQGRTVEVASKKYECASCPEGFSYKRDWIAQVNHKPCPCKIADQKERFKPIKKEDSVPIEMVDSSILLGLMAK